jgi:hypothetical protein
VRKWAWAAGWRHQSNEAPAPRVRPGQKDVHYECLFVSRDQRYAGDAHPADAVAGIIYERLREPGRHDPIPLFSDPDIIQQAYDNAHVSPARGSDHERSRMSSNHRRPNH